MAKLAFLFFLLLAGVCSAQRKGSAVIVVGKVINAEDSLRIKEYFYEALKENVKSNTAESGRYFHKILDIDPANAAALYELARLYHAQAQGGDAERYARQAVTVEPDNKWYWLLLADIYKKARNLDQLILVFNELIKLDPRDENYYFDKANAFLIQNKKDQAETVFSEIEQLFGSSEQLISVRQRVSQQQGGTLKPASELESLVATNPADIRNYLNLSEVYLKSGNPAKAVDILNKAKEIDGSDPYVSLALADVYKSSGNSDKAFLELKNAFTKPSLNIDAKVQIVLSFFPELGNEKVRKESIELANIITKVHPADPKAFSVYGDVLYQDNQLEESKKAYRSALGLNSQVYQIWEQILSIGLSQRDYAAVIKDGEEALSLFPNQARLYFFTALAYAQTAKHEKAISLLQGAAGLEFDNKTFLSQIYASLGDSFNSLKKFADSDQAYGKALSFNPDNVFVLNNYAYYLSLRNQALEKAAAMSKRSNELQAGNASFQDTYAWVLFRQKNYKEARIWIEKAIGNNKESATQLEHYGDILFSLGEKENAIIQWKQAKEMGLKSDLLDKKIYEKKYIE